MTTAPTSALDPASQAAVERFDTIGRSDPRTVSVDGIPQPHQLVESKWLEHYLLRLSPAPSTAALMACHCQHLARWQSPREEFPADREGYLRWRRAASQRSAEQATTIMTEVGVAPELVAAVVAIIVKRDRSRNADCQLMEDALCLTFLRLDAPNFAPRHPVEKVRQILTRTWRKMSESARQLALTEPFDGGVSDLIRLLAFSDQQSDVRS